MQFITGKLTITKCTSNQQEDYIKLKVKDLYGNRTCIEVDITDFSKALFGMAEQDCFIGNEDDERKTATG